MMTIALDTNLPSRHRFATHTGEPVMDHADAVTSEVFITMPEPGEAPPLHQHDITEHFFEIIQKRGRLEISSPLRSFPAMPGNPVRIPRCTPNRMQRERKVPLKWVAGSCFPIGRPTVEPTWNSHVQVACRNQGWDIQKMHQHPAA